MRQLGEAAAGTCCCETLQGFEIHVGAESAANIRKASQAIAAALPGMLPIAQPGTCLASLNMSSALLCVTSHTQVPVEVCSPCRRVPALNR